MRRHHISFKHAIEGLVWVLKTQPNFRIHTIVAFLTVFFAWKFKVNRSEWLSLLSAIMLVIVAEMINTALESMTDLITTQYHTQAKIAKDVSAGMVLISAFFAVVVGLVVLIPHLSSSII